MLSKETRKKIIQMVQDESLGREIIVRMSLLQKTPKTKEQVRSILNAFNKDHNDRILTVLKSKMANYDHGSCGNEIANGLCGVVDILEAALQDQDLKALKENLDGEMDKISYEALAIAITSINCAKNFQVVYNQMISAVSAIETLSDEPAPKPQIIEELPPEILVEAKQERVHIEAAPKPVVVKRIFFKKK